MTRSEPGSEPVAGPETEPAPGAEAGSTTGTADAAASADRSPTAPDTGSGDGSEPVDVQISVDQGISTLVLDAQANRNALSAPLVDSLAGHLKDAAGNPGVRAVILTHAGTTFCAGADLAEAAREGGPEKGTARLVALLRQIVDLPKPVVACLDGHVRGGGLGLLGACDIVVAGHRSSFAFTEARIGVAPAVIALTVLPRLTDRAAARYFLTGDRFSAEEAARIGLVTQTATDPDAAVGKLVASFRACSPQGLAESKALTTAALRETFDTDAARLTGLSARLFASKEAQEGIAAFREGRSPAWSTRPLT